MQPHLTSVNLKVSVGIVTDIAHGFVCAALGMETVVLSVFCCLLGRAHGTEETIYIDIGGSLTVCHARFLQVHKNKCINVTSAHTESSVSVELSGRAVQ